MSKVKEIKIDSTLWHTPARLVNLLNFNPDKLRIESSNEKD